MSTTTGTRRSTSRVLPSAVAILIAGALAGCGSVNAGTAGKRTTEREFRNDPAIESVELTSSNTLPWSGSVGGSLTARAGLSDDELAELVDRVGAFESQKHDGASVSLQVVVDDVTLHVLPDRARNARLVAVANQLRGDTGVVSAEIEMPVARGARLTALTVSADRAFELAAATPEPLREQADEPPVEIDVSSEDGVSLEGVQGGTWIADAQRVWATVGLRVRVDELQATPETIDLHVADPTEVAAARQAAESALGDHTTSLSVE